MNKLGTFIGLKPSIAAVVEKPASPPEPEKLVKNVVDLDNELFLPTVTQLGEENEAVRNLLIDAEHKVSELDAIKRSIGRLVDPVSKTLRALEEAKSEKIGLQGALNTTRIANSKLHSELGAAEKKAATFESECARLREIVTDTQQRLSSLEITKAEQTTELTARRTQIADLQRRVQQQSADLQLARDENRRLNERMSLTDKRAVQLESDAEAIRQKFMVSEKERTTIQTSFDKALAELTQVSHRLLDTDKALAATQIRMQKAELALAEAQAERHRLATALDDANQKHQSEINSHRSNYETLQARSTLTDKLLDDARQSLAERSEEIRALDRRLADSARTHSVIGEKLGLIEEALAERSTKLKELEQARAALTEQNDLLTKAVSTRENAYNRAQEHIQSLEERMHLLESELRSTRQTADMENEILNSKLQREQIARTMAEGALEAGRKDIARLLHELATLQYRPHTLSNAQGNAQQATVEPDQQPATRDIQAA